MSDQHKTRQGKARNVSLRSKAGMTRASFKQNLDQLGEGTDSITEVDSDSNLRALPWPQSRTTDIGLNAQRDFGSEFLTPYP